MKIALPAFLVGAALADWLFTTALLNAGATEVNPLFAGLLNVSPVGALFIKVFITLVGAIGLACLWRYRLARRGIYVLCVVYGLLLIYEFVLWAMF
jgi:hypothetical protein